MTDGAGLPPLRRVAAIVLLGLAAASSRAAAEDLAPISIGVIGPFTGGTSAQGISIRDGARLAVEEVNAAGGLLGRPIVIVERNDESYNELGAKVAAQLTANHAIVAAVGLANTGVALAASPFFEENEVPLIVSAATGTLVTTRFVPPGYAANYIFRVAANDRLQTSLIAEMVVKQGYLRPAIFHDTTSYGRLGRADLEAALAVLGLKAVTEEKFNIGDTDMNDQLRRARAANADVILTYGIGPELAHVALSRIEIGWPAPLVGSWTLSMDSFSGAAGTAGDGAEMPQTFIEASGVPRRRAFVDAYRRRFATDHIPTPPAGAQSYDAIKLLAAAITQAQSVDGPKIKDALENLAQPVDGVIATYRRPFTAIDHEAIGRDNVVFGVVRDGVVIADHTR
ncbi:MAG: Extracellular ligand-binding receptor [Rhodospirillales bacterium]|jgi:branched-chain amino acid transport system substrate-binding protein|nr:Extracellular ligand-binding receptor [Rhodospirillales bacterium]